MAIWIRLGVRHRRSSQILAIAMLALHRIGRLAEVVYGVARIGTGRAWSRVSLGRPGERGRSVIGGASGGSRGMAPGVV